MPEREAIEMAVSVDNIFALIFPAPEIAPDTPGESQRIEAQTQESPNASVRAAAIEKLQRVAVKPTPDGLACNTLCVNENHQTEGPQETVSI